MTDAERAVLIWGAFALLLFLTSCAVVDLFGQTRPDLVTPPEAGPSPSMVSQLLEEARNITKRAAREADADDAE